MAESSNLTHIPSSPKLTLKEEPDTQDRPNSLNPFLPTNQAEFTFDEISFTTNNEVEVSDGSNLSIFRRKNRWDDQIPNKDAIILYYLANGVEVDFARLIWEDIIHKLKKKTKEKIVPYPRFISILLEYMMPEYKNDELTLNPTQVFSVHNWALKPNQPKGPPFTDHMLAICNAYVPMEFKAPKTSSQAEKKVS
ncbi:hypothetical protein Tco_1139286 [Tanacetum coccineum]